MSKYDVIKHAVAVMLVSGVLAMNEKVQRCFLIVFVLFFVLREAILGLEWNCRG